MLRRRWALIGACILVGLAVAAGWTATRPVSYSASAEAFVAIKGDTNGAAAAYQGSLFSQERVKSYVEIVATPLVLDPVRASLGLDITTEQLADKVTASAPVDTVIVTIAVTDESPERARDLTNAVVQEFAAVVPRLEASGSNTTAPVAVTIIRRANTPADPISPNPALNLALGFVVGLLIGVVSATLREKFDTGIKRADDIVSATGTAPIAEITQDRAAEKDLVVHENARSPRAEAFRRLRTNLQFLRVDSPPRSIVITSPSSGDGKSMTACNLAASLAQSGERVVLVEADLRRPVFDKYLRVEPAAGLTSLLIGAADIEDVLQPWRDANLKVLASGPIPPNPSELLGSKNMIDLLDALSRSFDHVILDAPPLLPVTDGAVVSALADGVLLVATVKKTKREHLTSAIEALRTVDAQLLGVVLNRVPAKGPDSYSYGYSHKVEADRRHPRLTAANSHVTPSSHQVPTTGRHSPVVAPGDASAYRSAARGAPPEVYHPRDVDQQLDETSSAPGRPHSPPSRPEAPPSSEPANPAGVS